MMKNEETYLTNFRCADSIPLTEKFFNMEYKSEKSSFLFFQIYAWKRWIEKTVSLRKDRTE